MRTLRDYPVTVRQQSDGGAIPPYFARIDGWPTLVGFGDTREQALAELEANFEQARSDYAARGEPLPAPGVEVPIKFAATERVERQATLTRDFATRVLGHPEAWISDKTHLHDFGGDVDAWLARTRELYGVDVTDLADAPLIAIVERLAAARRG